MPVFPPENPVFPFCFHIKAIPKQPKTEYLSTMDDGTVKIRVAATPERGRANAEIIRFLAEVFAVSKDRVEILSGGADAFKLVRIRGSSPR